MRVVLPAPDTPAKTTVAFPCARHLRKFIILSVMVPKSLMSSSVYEIRDFFAMVTFALMTTGGVMIVVRPRTGGWSGSVEGKVSCPSMK